MKIYLIRHGETDWNQINRLQGREDIPLNDAGIAQAQAAGTALQNLEIAAIYTSPLGRAVRTSQEISAKIGLTDSDIHTLVSLIERDLGSFSGQVIENKQEYFALAAKENVPGMEPFSEVLNRMQNALTELEATGHTSVAAVSHGAAINVLLAGLSNHEIGTGKTKLYNGGITLIEGNSKEGFHIVLSNLHPDDARQKLETL